MKFALLASVLSTVALASNQFAAEDLYSRGTKNVTVEYGHGGETQQRGGEGRLTTNQGTPVPDNENSLKTVSYTHLRAHESSLHLVGRLLLEKKN